MVPFIVIQESRTKNFSETVESQKERWNFKTLVVKKERRHRALSRTEKNKNTPVSSIKAWNEDLPDAEFVIVRNKYKNMLYKKNIKNEMLLAR